MKTILSLVWLCAVSVTAEEEKWVSLFDGKTLNGWVARNEANWRVEDGAIVVDKGPIGLLTTEKVWINYQLIVEFRAQAGTNSGVFLQSKSVVKDESQECYELNIAPTTNPFPTGSLVKRKLFSKAEEITKWRKFKVIVKDGHVRVWLDGEPTVDYQDENPLKSGFIGLQMNQGKVEFRNIRILEMP